MGESFTKEAEEMDEELLSDAIRREEKSGASASGRS